MSHAESQRLFLMEKIVRWSFLNIFIFLKRIFTLFLQLMESLFLEELSTPSSPAGQPFGIGLPLKECIKISEESSNDC